MEIDPNYFIQHLPKDTLGEIFTHVSLDLDTLKKLDRNKISLSRVVSIQPKDPSQRVEGVPYSFIQLFPNVERISRGYPLQIDTVDEFISVATNTKLREAYIDLEYFMQRITSYSRTSKESIRGRHYRTDEDIKRFLLMIEGVNHSKVTQLTLAAFFINLRVEAEKITTCISDQTRRPRRKKFLFQLGEYVEITQDTLRVISLGLYARDNLLSNITQKYFLSVYEGVLNRGIISTLLTFPCLKTVKAILPIHLMSPDVTALQEAGKEVIIQRV